MVKISISRDDAGQRVDRFLRKSLGGAPLSRIYKLLRRDVRLNGKRPEASELLKEGDELALYISEEEWQSSAKRKRQTVAKRQFAVVYEDAQLLAVNKPAGLLVHGDGQERKNSLASQVLAYLIEKGEYIPRRGGSFAPAPANRLDRNTSGLVLFGKSAAALRELNELIRERRLRKFYLALASGRLEGPTLLEAGLERDAERNVSLISDSEEAKLMRTYARPLESAKWGAGELTLLELELLTGRTHQIRLQLADAGLPIVGDAKYGDPKTNGYAAERYGAKGQLLCAYRLCFEGSSGVLEYMNGRRLSAPPNRIFRGLAEDVFTKSWEKKVF